MASKNVYKAKPTYPLCEEPNISDGLILCSSAKSN